MQIFRRVLQGIWVVVLLAVLVSTTASVWLAGRYVLVDYVSLIPQWLFLFPLLFLWGTAWSIFRQRWLKGAAFVLVVMSTLTWAVTLDVIWQHTAHNATPILRVFSWNTAVWDSVRQPEFVAQMKAVSADVYLLQEVHYKKNPELHGYLMEQFPGYEAGHYGEYVTLSRFPLNCNVEDRLGGFLACVTYVPEQGPLMLVNVHLKRPFHVTNFETVWDFDTRWTQFNQLAVFLRSVEMPVIIAGDFNSTANYPFIRTLNQEYVKNNPAGIFVLPHTFPANFPYMRIDYQFVSEPFQFCGYEEVAEPSLSDHVGIVGSLCRI